MTGYAVRLLGYEGQTICEMRVPDCRPSIDLAVSPPMSHLLDMDAGALMPMDRITYEHTNTAEDGTLIYRQRRLEIR